MEIIYKQFKDLKVRQMPERTYIDQLSELHESVQSDEIMPDYEKFYILDKIYELEAILEKYSG